MTGGRATRAAALALLLLAPLALAWRGEWRAGRDSARYRDLARQLAAGDGYATRGEPERLAYPGLPLMLAAVERASPQPRWRPTAALLLMSALAAATLGLCFAWLRASEPALAWPVTAALALHPGLLLFSTELLTEIPFMAATLAALWAWQRLGRADLDARARWAAFAAAAAALAAARLLRPSFLFLAVPWALLALPRSPRRRVALGALAVALAIGLAIDLLLAPETALVGGYARAAAARLAAWPEQHAAADAWRVLAQDWPLALLGIAPPPALGLVVSAASLAALGALARRHPLPVACAACTLAGALLLGTRPRYFVVLAPIVLTALAAALLRLALAARVAAGAGYAVCAVAGLLLLSAEPAADPRLRAHADAIERTTPAGARVLAREARILAYLTGRDVRSPCELTAASTTEGAAASALAAAHVEWALACDDSDDGLAARLSRSGAITAARPAGDCSLLRLGAPSAHAAAEAGEWRCWTSR